MTTPDPLSGLSFSDAPVPDHTASDEAPPITPPPNPGAAEQKKRTLPGRGIFGSRDNAPRQERAKAINPKLTERKPLPPIPANMAEKIEQLYSGAAVAIMPWDVELAGAVMEAAPKCAEAWVEVARQNRAVRILLLKLIETGAWSALIAAHGPIFKLALDRAMGKSPRTNMIAEYLARSVHPDEQPPPAPPET